MRDTGIDTMMFFAGHEEALPIYERLEETIREMFPDVSQRVQKTQISFSCRYVFACVSFARVKRKAELPDPFIVLTLGLPGPLSSGRVAVKVEPYPGRWTTHIVIGSVDEIDEELTGWIRQAYAFAATK
ncbi:MAG: hypothetical protein IJM26_08870 [Lachnospiraceae bacterium]|nr:hypothetical protein [Lachnospiraceae bacterium]